MTRKDEVSLLMSTPVFPTPELGERVRLEWHVNL